MTTNVVKGVFIVGAKRTPFGKFGGHFKNTNVTDLGEVVAKAALASSGVKPELVDSVVFGNVRSNSSRDAAFLARHVLLRSGIPESKPALTLNRLCGSSFQSIITGAQEIMLGESNIVLTGGSENMTQIPFCVRGIRFGTRLGERFEFEDMATSGIDTHVNMSMAITAENLAEKYGITREEADGIGLLSQQRWKEANSAGRFKAEIAPVTIKVKGKDQQVDTDEHPRPDTTLEVLAKLPAVFKKGGTVTAGNASGVCDGAGAVILASEAAVKTHQLNPLARVVGYSVVGVDPAIMGIGPVPAIRQLLKKTGMTLQQIDLIEVNEAFASQFLAVQKELQLDPGRSNLNGGAIAVGHPLGATGSRIMGHLVHELRRKNARLALGAACIGGGQGIAIMVEKC